MRFTQFQKNELSLKIWKLRYLGLASKVQLYSTSWRKILPQKMRKRSKKIKGNLRVPTKELKSLSKKKRKNYLTNSMKRKNEKKIRNVYDPLDENGKLNIKNYQQGRVGFLSLSSLLLIKREEKLIVIKKEEEIMNEER